MKAIKIIIIFSAVIFGGFFALGIFKPSIDYGASVDVSKSPEIAWSVYTDSSLISEWIPAIKSMKKVSGESWMVGSVYEIQMDHEGELVTVLEEITAYDENKLMGMTFTNDLMTTTNAVTFEAKEDGGTTISTKCTAEGANFFWKSMFAMMSEGFNKQEMTHMVNLAVLIERTEPVIEEIPEVELAIDSLAVDTLIAK